MAINDSGTRNQYTATASQTVFAYTFEIFATGDIKVEQNGAVITAYTVSNVGVDTGGNVTLTTGATAGDIITIYRDMALERLTDYAQNGDFLADDVNNDYNRLWAALQQSNNNLGASIRPAVSDSELNSTNTELANVATRAGKVLGFDATGLLSYTSAAIAAGDFTDVTTTAAMTALTGVSVGDVVQTAEFSTGNGGGGTYDCVTVGVTANVDLPNTYNIIVSTVDNTKCFVLRVENDHCDVSAFGGNDDITAAIQACANFLPSTGGTIDALGITGTQTLTDSIFDDVKKPIRFIGGNTTYQWDIATINHNLSSKNIIIGNGTVFQPDGDGESATNSTNNGLFTTLVETTTGTMSAASRDITLADISLASVGDVIAIDGAQGGDATQSTTLNGALTDAATTIPINASNSTFPSNGLIYINSEAIEYTGRDGSNFTGCTRGVLGTTAAAHSDTDTVEIMLKLRGVIESISGSVATIRAADSASTIAVTSADAFIGQQGVKFLGDLTINGRADRSGPDASPSVLGVKLRYARGCEIGDDVKFLNIDQGGAYLESSYGNLIAGRYDEIGRPATSLGADIWIFQNSKENIIKAKASNNGYTHVIIDNRTTNAGAADGPSNNNYVEIPPLTTTPRAITVSGSSNNHCEIPYASTSSDTITVSGVQGSTPEVPSNNTFNCGTIISSTNYANVTGTNNKVTALNVSGTNSIADGNSLRVQPNKILIKDTTVDFASLTSNTRGVADVTVTGASAGTVGGSAGDAVSIEFTDPGMNDGTLKGFVIDAWVHAADTVRVQAWNSDSATHDAVSINIRLTVTGAVENIP